MKTRGLILLLALSACRPAPEASAEMKLPAAQGQPCAVSDSQGLMKVKRVPAEDVARTGVKQGFEVACRIPELKRWDCSGCHTAIPERREGAARGDLMHTDIVLKHAQGSTMDCRSCHDEKDARQLKLMDGTPVSFDAAYRVCAQCHFQQHRDWANGAHGKRLNQWQGERVVLSCTGCHNPHSPAFDKRFPKARPTLPGTRPYSTELPKELGAPHGGHGHE